jgi:hypothetical protein
MTTSAEGDVAWTPRFWFMEPSAPRRPDSLFRLERQDGSSPGLLQLPSAPVDVYDARLPATQRRLRRELRYLCEIPRMSTFANAALINRAVAQMAPGHTFVNVGVWNGFTFLSGVTANPDRTCVGIDDFSQFGGPRDAFLERFERVRSTRHHFHELDYRDYFATVHSDPIGVYLYDGEHSYDNQLEGLRAAEGFLRPGSIVLVDDTNWEEPHAATLDFMRSGKLEYELLLDQRTAANAHPTVWNGLMAIRATRERSGKAPAPPGEGGEASPRAAQVPGDEESRRSGREAGAAERPRVSIVILADGEHPDRLTAAVDGALGQDWERLEVLVAEGEGATRVADATASYGDRVKRLPASAGGEPALDQALNESDGDLVAFTDTGAPLPPGAIKVALGFPLAMQFFRPLEAGQYEERERAVFAAEEIAAAIAPGDGLAMVAGGVPVPRTLRPRLVGRLELDGEPPHSQGDLVAELERMRERGAGAIAVLWPAFEPLRRSGGLYDHLRSRSRLVVDSDRVKLFDIRHK